MSLFIKALKSDDSPPSRWCRFKWWLDENSPDWLNRLFRSLFRFYIDQISTRLLPRQRWLTKQIPRDWRDKTSLIPDILYAMVVHFVEQERCFEVTDWKGSGHEEQEAKLREIYAWIKAGRAQAEKEADLPWIPEELNLNAMSGKTSFFRDDKGDFAAYCAATDAIEAKDTEYLIWICINRNLLWT